jgi:HEPN domain-containing protein
MNTSLKHLTHDQLHRLEIVKNTIIRALHPEKIILFGVYNTPAQIALFSEKFDPGTIPFDLFVVTRSGDQRTDYELQDMIENRCRAHAPVTALVHDIGFINQRLSEGHYFFSSTCQDGTLIYDARRIRLGKAWIPDISQVWTTAGLDYKRWSQQARAFFYSALYNLETKEWKLATFLLHQSAEQMYQAILLAFTGYKPTTHNLDKLRRYTNRLSIELALLFPDNTADEKELFRLLLAGYVDARYKEDFTISKVEIDLLTDRIKQLLEIGERICKERLSSLERKITRVDRPN